MPRLLLAVVLVVPLFALPSGVSAATGNRIVYAYSAASDLEPRGIFSIKPDGTGRQRLTRQQGYDIQWSPDRSLISFVEHSCVRSDCEAYINVMRPDGSELRHFTPEVFSIDSYDWAPDSTRIVYSAFDPADNQFDLFVASEGQAPTALTDTAEDYETQPDWSPDGSTIVFDRSGPSAEDLFAVSPEGEDERRLTNDDHLESQPRWSPNGAHIAFVTSRDDATQGEDAPYTNQLYVMNADGSDPRRVSRNERTLKTGPRWSLDSTRIAWHEECDMDWCDTDLDVWVSSVDGDPKNLTKASSLQEQSPQWSANGRKLVFVRWRRSSARTGLYSIRSTGGPIRKVVDAPGPEESLAYQSW